MITEKIPSVRYEGAGRNLNGAFRIEKVMKRAAAGEEICIGFIGGSITQGCLASAPDRCYAHKVFEWFSERFPGAHFRYVNAGIGATDSQFACARVQSDLLSYEPDLCFAEFSVNDGCNGHYHETYEGLVRRILLSSQDRALMLIYNVVYENGDSAEPIHSMVSDRYSVPAVSIGSAIWPEIESGRLKRASITSDGLHPNDVGHSLVASVIISVLEEIADNMNESGLKEISFPDPETENAYEDSVRYRNDCPEGIVTECRGFAPDLSPQEGITDIFKKGWTASEKGSYIVFKIRASCIGIQYRKTVRKPAPAAVVTVDGDTSHEVLLDADFEETWGDKLSLDTVLDHGAGGEHIVRIELTETHDNDALPFYLVSVTASGN